MSVQPVATVGSTHRSDRFAISALAATPVALTIANRRGLVTHNGVCPREAGDQGRTARNERLAEYCFRMAQTTTNPCRLFRTVHANVTT
jgi:hypothetical protein